MRRLRKKSTVQKNTEKENPYDIKEYLSLIRNASFVIAVYLYFTGWIFIYFYDASFGIPVNLSGAEIIWVIMYSWSVIYSYGFLFIIVALLVGLIIYLLRNLPLVLKPVQVTLCFLLFLLLYITGKNTGEDVAKEVRISKTLPPIIFEFKNDGTDLSAIQNRHVKKLYEANNKGLLCYLTENSSSYFAVYQPGTDNPINEIVRGYVFEIQRDRVKSITKIIDR
jgi:hypothetical protein